MEQPHSFNMQHSARFERATLITGDSITVLVGKGQSARAFPVHRALICASSPFFDAACRWPSRASRAPAAAAATDPAPAAVVNLPDEDPATFELFVRWLYTGELVDFWTAPAPAAATDESAAAFDAHSEYAVLACAFLLGDAVLCAAFRNAVVDAVAARARATNRYPCALARLVWENAGPSSALRRLLVDFYAFAGAGDWFAAGPEAAPDVAVDGPREFLREVLARVVDVREQERGGGDVGREECYPWVVDCCRFYHDHPDGVGCGAGE